MAKYNPNLHHRRSIRLKGYDYSQAGLYFITMCVQHRECLFGKITVAADGNENRPQMVLNDAGKMVEKWYWELENKFPDIKCDEMIIMPNHFHCIIENVGPVGADLRVCTVLDLRVCPPVLGEHTTLGEHIGSPLHRVVQWFKTMSTNEYIRGVKNLGWPPFDGKLWQRNYYEHIIRNEQSHKNIANYIKNNPAKWKGDIFYA